MWTGELYANAQQNPPPLPHSNLLTSRLDSQKRANAAIQEVEREGYERQLLNPNCVEMLRMLKV